MFFAPGGQDLAYNFIFVQQRYPKNKPKKEQWNQIKNNKKINKKEIKFKRKIRALSSSSKKMREPPKKRGGGAL